MKLDDRVRFIVENTVLGAVPFVPELELHVASKVSPLWEATQRLLDTWGLPPPFWAFPWAGGQALARFILDHSSEFEGATVLDLGCGSGLVGLAAKRAGARTVTCADTDGFACLAVDLNAKANGLDVETSEEDPTGTWTRFVDVIVAGDVCYEPAMAEKHLAWLGAQAKKGTRVFLGDPGRAYGPSNASVGPWSDLVERKRYGVPVVEDLESVPVKQTSVWQWRIGP